MPTQSKIQPIWGLKPTQRWLWDNLAEGDTVLFYATMPVAGVIGYGTIRTKFVQDKPLWPEEIEKGQVIWPLRFEFDVEYCLPPDRWKTDKITSDVLKKGAVRGFQSVETGVAQQIIAGFNEVATRGKRAGIPLHG